MIRKRQVSLGIDLVAASPSAPPQRLDLQEVQFFLDQPGIFSIRSDLRNVGPGRLLMEPNSASPTAPGRPVRDCSNFEFGTNDRRGDIADPDDGDRSGPRPIGRQPDRPADARHAPVGRFDGSGWRCTGCRQEYRSGGPSERDPVHDRRDGIAGIRPRRRRREPDQPAPTSSQGYALIGNGNGREWSPAPSGYA